jgi:hypothetical protein
LGLPVAAGAMVDPTPAAASASPATVKLSTPVGRCATKAAARPRRARPKCASPRRSLALQVQTETREPFDQVTDNPCLFEPVHIIGEARIKEIVVLDEMTGALFVELEIDMHEVFAIGASGREYSTQQINKQRVDFPAGFVFPKEQRLIARFAYRRSGSITPADDFVFRFEFRVVADQNGNVQVVKDTVNAECV